MPPAPHNNHAKHHRTRRQVAVLLLLTWLVGQWSPVFAALQHSCHPPMQGMTQSGGDAVPAMSHAHHPSAPQAKDTSGHACCEAGSTPATTDTTAGQCCDEDCSGCGVAYGLPSREVAPASIPHHNGPPRASPAQLSGHSEVLLPPPNA